MIRATSFSYSSRFILPDLIPRLMSVEASKLLCVCEPPAASVRPSALSATEIALPPIPPVAAALMALLIMAVIALMSPGVIMPPGSMPPSGPAGDPP